MTSRFYVAPEAIRRTGAGKDADGGDELPFFAVIRGGEAHHAVNVLRLGTGDPVVLLDGGGDEYWGAVRRVVDGSDGPEVEVAGTAVRVSPSEPPVDVFLVQGLPKGDKLDEIVEKGTEVGVTHFLPVHTERSVVRYSDGKAEQKRSRLERIARGATKQARRGRIPQILPFERLSDAVAGERLQGLTWIAFWEQATTPLRQIAGLVRGEGQKNRRGLALFIGPEGGFTEDEVQVLVDHGAHVVSLGRRILRTETAGPVAAALILYALEEEA